jgi:AcrR family transcriptional regulator
MVRAGRAVKNPAGRRLGRPADTDSTDTRERMVVCARERFATEGFDGTTNKRIADDAGVSSAALYHYFPSKADLYVAVCESIATELDAVVGRAGRAETLLERRVAALFTEIGVLSARAPSIVGFIAGISAVVRTHPEVLRGANALGARFRHVVVDLVVTAGETDRLLHGASAEAFADVVIAVLAGMGRMSAGGEHARSLEAGEAFLGMLKASMST